MNLGRFRELTKDLSNYTPIVSPNGDHTYGVSVCYTRRLVDDGFGQFSEYDEVCPPSKPIKPVIIIE